METIEFFLSGLETEWTSINCTASKTASLFHVLEEHGGIQTMWWKWSLAHAKLLNYTHATLPKPKLQQESCWEINDVVSHVPVLSLTPSPLFDFTTVSVAIKVQGNLSQPYTHICSLKKTVKHFACSDHQSRFQMPGLTKKIPGQAIVIWNTTKVFQESERNRNSHNRNVI